MAAQSTKPACATALTLAAPMLAALLFAAQPAMAQVGQPSSVSAEDADRPVDAPALPEPLTRQAIRDVLSGLSDGQARELLLRELDRQVAAREAALAGAQERRSRHRLGVTNRMRDDDAPDRPSNVGLCRELERIVPMLLHNNRDLITIGSHRARLASGSKKRCRQPPARCGQGPVSCKVCRTCHFSIDRLNACLRKGRVFRPFRGDVLPETPKVAEYVHCVHEAAYGAPFILPRREDRFVIRTINHQRLDTRHQRKLQVQRLVHDILRQTFDPISFRRQRTRHEDR